MRNEWEEVELGEHVALLNGFAFKSQFFSDDTNDVTLIKGANLGKGQILWNSSVYWPKNNLSSVIKYLLKPLDIVLAMDRPWVSGGLKYAMLKEGDPQSLLVQRVACLRAKSTLNQLFLKYVIGSIGFSLYIKSIQGGVGVPHISPAQIKSYTFKLPPLQIQKKIASILSSYDDLIENNQKRIKLLEEKARLTYEEWFVRMRFPGHESTPINKETGLPEGWEQLSLGSLAEVSSSKRVFLSDYVSKGVPFYRGKEIILKSKNESLKEVLYISEDKFKSLKNKYGTPQSGDVLLTAVGTLGYPYLVTENDGDFYFKDGNLIWIKRSPTIGPEYLISCFKSVQFQNMLKNIAIGSSQKALTIRSLKEVKINKPDASVETDFKEKIRPVFSLIDSCKKQNTLLKEARDLLLPRLMMGLVDVDELLPA